MEFRNGTIVAVLRDGEVLYPRVRVASSFLSRLRGLLGTPTLAPGEGLLIVPCDAIHMFFMRYPIDAVFMDEAGRVVRIYRTLRPWRMTPVVGGAWMVLELASGQADPLSVGDHLSFVPVEEPSSDSVRSP